jgi:hypothetical protein
MARKGYFDVSSADLPIMRRLIGRLENLPMLHNFALWATGLKATGSRNAPQFLRSDTANHYTGCAGDVRF